MMYIARGLILATAFAGLYFYTRNSLFAFMSGFLMGMNLSIWFYLKEESR